MKVAIVMGSQSDLPIMQEAIDFLKEMQIPVLVDIVSAHRTPEKLISFGKNAHKEGINVIIAGAGGAAHLPGMLAAVSPLPIIGVPIKSRNSIGIPVATVALNGAKNAGILATEILGAFNKDIQERISSYKKSLEEAVEQSAQQLKQL